MNFKATVRTKNEYNKVYLRITSTNRVDYIPTTMTVHKSAIRKGEITDPIVKANCALKIKRYIEKLNNTDTKSWTLKEIKQFLMDETENGDISFTDYAALLLRWRTKDATSLLPITGVPSIR